MHNENSPLILFDGVCKLCNGSVKFIIKRDSKAVFKFQALQNYQNLQQVATHFQNQVPDSIILIQDGIIYSKSTAVLKICKNLDGLWPLLYALFIIPKPFRDYLYMLIAKNRYVWFGKYEKCTIPDENFNERFIEK